ncbi:VOC family protein [Amycolatopsis endophytica]|uniref:VOC domain-containing protein n=1 Tax=Amycolatopsis endophytica TaxID=860233 RepID=A0A853BDC4_9PSEU|nr:VOC family protein [Amycolatopsis endophytica]NYI93000.1 hypothetical protein [Amycolatopsis endophytica]
MPIATLAAINVDCTDPLALARFWAALLGGEVVIATPDFCAVQAGPVHLGAVRVAAHQAPTWPSAEHPKQLHLDLAAQDLDAAEHEAIHLGATRESHQPDPARFRVLRDPAGHPFCLRAR